MGKSKVKRQFKLGWRNKDLYEGLIARQANLNLLAQELLHIISV